MQIARILKEFYAGKSTEEITRLYSVSKAVFYKWRQRYGGMDASELKRMYAELALDLEAARWVIEKKL